MAFLAPGQTEQSSFDLLGKPQDPTQKDWFSTALPQILQSSNAFGTQGTQQDQGTGSDTPGGIAVNSIDQLIQALMFNQQKSSLPDSQGSNIGQEQFGGGPTDTGINTSTPVTGNIASISPSQFSGFNPGAAIMSATGSPVGLNLGFGGSVSPRINTGNATVDAVANAILSQLSVNVPSLLGQGAMFAGPQMTIGALQALVGAAGKIAGWAGVPTVHEGLVGLQGNPAALSAAQGELSAALSSIGLGSQSINLSPQAADLAVAMGLGPNLFAGPQGTQLMNVGNVANSAFSAGIRGSSAFGQAGGYAAAPGIFAQPTIFSDTKGIFASPYGAPRSGGDDPGEGGPGPSDAGGPGATGSGGVDAP